jgi:hypothetical protein
MLRPNFLSLDPPNSVPTTVLKYLNWGDWHRKQQEGGKVWEALKTTSDAMT